MMKPKLLMLALLIACGGLFPAAVAGQEAAAPAGPDTVTLAGGKRGPVTFTHRKHAEAAECVACHHESKPEKALESEHQKCSACHTNPATEPVKTTLRNAMHDTGNKAGVCYNCHEKELAAGSTSVPAKCGDCHKQDG